MYFFGLVKGDLTSRAGSISFSFFMAIFPALLFVLNLMPYIPIANFTETFSRFVESAMPLSSQDFFMSIYTDIQTHQHGGLLSSSFLLSKTDSFLIIPIFLNKFIFKTSLSV